MANPAAQAVCRSVEALSRSHGHAPAIDVLAVVMYGRAGQVFDFEDAALEHRSLASPRSAFGQVLVAAFDTSAPADEWLRLTGAEAHPVVRQAMLVIWREHVVSKFDSAYGVTSQGLPLST